MRIQSRKVTAARVRRFFWLLRHMWAGYCALDYYDADGRAMLVGATTGSLVRGTIGCENTHVFWSKA